MLLFCLTTKTYLSPQLLVYIPKDLPVHDPTCSFCLFHSDKPVPSPVVLNIHRFNNNNEYLERLTCTGPKCLHILTNTYLSKFNAYNMNAQTRTCTHAHNAHTQTHTAVAYQSNQGNETEEKVFKKRKVFKEDLKELTEVEWWTETGSWFQITGTW